MKKKKETARCAECGCDLEVAARGKVLVCLACADVVDAEYEDDDDELYSD